MGDLSPHFDKIEFKCKCGNAHEYTIAPELIVKLEKLYDLMGAAAIVITSGFRCPSWSKNVGGYMNDAHTKGIAADIQVVRNVSGKPFYNSDDVAEAAERVGFSGIGIIDGTAIHVDVRNSYNYVNDHWFGDERFGFDDINTFFRGTVFDGELNRDENKHKITVYYDGVLISESEVN